jgi:hypothetical protein
MLTLEQIAELRNNVRANTALITYSELLNELEAQTKRAEHFRGRLQTFADDVNSPRQLAVWLSETFDKNGVTKEPKP